jgi:hypothetical protein
LYRKNNFIISFFFLLTSLHAYSPQWFNSQTLAHTPYQIIGYGQAQTYKEAVQSAKGQIAELLQVNVTSTIHIDKYSSSESYIREVNSTTISQSHVRLNSLKIIKKEQIKNYWFVAIVYNNLPLFLKITNSTHPKDEIFEHPYLIKTKLFKLLKEHFGFYPRAKIYAQNGQYYITIDNHQFLISQEEFVYFFFNSHSPNIKIELKDRLENNKAYFITTKFKEFGFASLFLVASSGTVVNLFKNIEVMDTTFTYPDENKYDGLRARIEDNLEQSREMFVALVCNKKEDIGLFNQISTNLEKDSFRFGGLIDLMERCTFSTKVFTIYKM